MPDVTGMPIQVAFAWLIHHDPGTALLDVQSHLLSRRKVHGSGSCTRGSTTHVLP